jgi:hypothetical protein
MINTTSEKALGRSSEGSKKCATNALDSTGTNPAQLELNLDRPKRKYSRKSTATRAQYERSIIMLRTGEKSTIDLRKAGVMMPAARIKELNDRHGYSIVRVALRDLWDEWGFCHKRIAIYALLGEPMEGGAA